MINEFWLITNYSCNNRCKWCYTESKGFPKEIMPLSYAKETLDEMKRLGAKKCTLIGGEPTVYPHMLELIKYGKSMGVFMKIVSNAILLKDEDYVEKLKTAGLSLIAISIHGATRETYERNTQNKAFDDVVLAIKNCIKKELQFVTLTTINRLNRDDILNTSIFLNELGVENVIFNIAVPNSNDENVEDLVLNPREIAETIQENYFKLKEKNIKAGFYASIPLCLFEREILNEMIESKYLIPLSQGGCNIYYKSGFSFDPLGSLLPCCKKIDDVLVKTMSSDGHFKYKGNFEEVWDDIQHNFGKEAIGIPSQKCNDCSIKENCIGGCPMFWDYFKAEKYIKTP